MSALQQLALLPEPVVNFASEVEREHFPTPPGIARYAVQKLLPVMAGPRLRILDPGAGTGVWGKAARDRWPKAFICGVDLPGVPRVPEYSFWRSQDFRSTARTWSQFEHIRFDVVVGNPPYSMAEEFIRLGCDVLKPGGYLVFFLRLAFWAGQKRGLGLWRDYPPYEIVPSSRRPSFTGNGVSDQKTEYALFVWRKGFRGPFRLPFDYKQPETW